MSYSLQQVVLPFNHTGLTKTGLAGFSSDPFRYLLFSEWICLGIQPRSASVLNTVGFFGVSLNLTGVHVQLLKGVSQPCFDGVFTGIPLGTVLCHVAVSVDLTNQILQVYVNRIPYTVFTGAGWTDSGEFNITPSFSNWSVGGAGSTAPGPGIGDLVVGAPTEFFNLSSNIDRLINPDLTPVDLGADASSIYGVPPAVYLTVRPAGVANDFAINNGAGGAFTIALPPLVFEPDNACVRPVPSPTGLACGPHTATTVELDWGAVTGATSYTLQYRVQPNTAWTVVTGITATSYTVIGLLPGSVVEWQVQTVGAGSSSVFSAIFQCTAGEGATPSFQFLSCENAFTLAPLVTQLYGFDHLVGMAVVGLLDGVPMAPVTVANDGSVTLPFPASDVKIGLPFQVQLQTPYLDAGAPTVQGRRKNVSAVTVRVEASNGIQVGTNQPDGAALTPPAIAPPWGATTPMTDDPAWSVQKQTYPSTAGQIVTKLVTGDVRVAVTSDWRTPGQVAIQQLQPLPMNILACIPELLEGDITEQGYSGEERPRQRADERRQQQGPGSWMLRR